MFLRFWFSNDWVETSLWRRGLDVTAHCIHPPRWSCRRRGRLPRMQSCHSRRWSGWSEWGGWSQSRWGRLTGSWGWGRWPGDGGCSGDTTQCRHWSPGTPSSGPISPTPGWRQGRTERQPPDPCNASPQTLCSQSVWREHWNTNISAENPMMWRF